MRTVVPSDIGWAPAEPKLGLARVAVGMLRLGEDIALRLGFRTVAEFRRCVAFKPQADGLVKPDHRTPSRSLCCTRTPQVALGAEAGGPLWPKGRLAASQLTDDAPSHGEIGTS